MNIAVLLKQVPDTEAVIKADPSNAGSIVEDNLKFILNTYDEYAVEEALQLKSKAGGDVVILSVGKPDALKTIRSALAMGGDRGILV